MLVLITYDINITEAAGARRLRRVAKQCVNYGTRVQNSVFECQVDATQYAKLKHLLLKEIDEEKDSLRFTRWVIITMVRLSIMAYGVEYRWMSP